MLDDISSKLQAIFFAPRLVYHFFWVNCLWWSRCCTIYKKLIVWLVHRTYLPLSWYYCECIWPAHPHCTSENFRLPCFDGSDNEPPLLHLSSLLLLESAISYDISLDLRIDFTLDYPLFFSERIFSFVCREEEFPFCTSQAMKILHFSSRWSDQSLCFSIGSSFLLGFFSLLYLSCFFDSLWWWSCQFAWFLPSSAYFPICLNDRKVERWLFVSLWTSSHHCYFDTSIHFS